METQTQISAIISAVKTGKFSRRQIDPPGRGKGVIKLEKGQNVTPAKIASMFNTLIELEKGNGQKPKINYLSTSPAPQSLQKNNEIEKCRKVCDEGIGVATTNGDLLVIKNLEELKTSLG